jgi:membrane protease YdiL (CAAX protease family)
VTTEPLQPPGPSDETPAEPLPARAWNAAERKILILFLLVAFVVPLPILFLLHPERVGAQSVWTVLSELQVKSVSALCVVLATWLAGQGQKRPLADYGIPPREIFGGRFWEGAVWGIALLSAILLVLRVTGNFEIQSLALTGKFLYVYALSWALAFFLVAISEEFGFRGYLLFILSRRAGFWRAAFALSAGFGVAHIPNPGETLFGILQVVAIGLFFCFTIRRTGNLWFAVGFHAFWDWAETFVYGAPDSGLIGEGHFLACTFHGPAWLSGGSAGPEGSILALLALVLAAFLVHLRFPRVVYPDRPR